MKRLIALLLVLSMLLLAGCGTEESAAPTASPNEAAYAAAEALMTGGGLRRCSRGLRGSVRL